MKLIDKLVSSIGRAFTRDLKDGAQASVDHARKSLDRVSIIAGSAVALALILGLLALYFGFVR